MTHDAPRTDTPDLTDERPLREAVAESERRGYATVVVARDDLAALLSATPAPLDAQRLTDAMNAVIRKQPSLMHAGFVYGETGAAVAAEYARLTPATATPEAGDA